MQEQWGPELIAVIRVLEAALAPAFLLAGVMGLLNVLTARLGRAIDRSRELQKRFSAEAPAQQEVLRNEYSLLMRRKRTIRASMVMSIAGAVIICLMICLLFIMGLTTLAVAWLIASMFALAMGLIASAMILLLIETSFSAHPSELSIEGVVNGVAGDSSVP